MRESHGYSGAQLAMAFLGGAAAGAAVAMLTTPKTGQETREQIGSYVRRGKQKTERLPDVVKTASNAAREAFDSAMEKAEMDMARAQ